MLARRRQVHSRPGPGPLAYRLVPTPWGPMAFVARRDRLAATLLPDADRQRLMATLASRWPEATLDRRLMPSLAAALADYFAGRAARFNVDIDLDDRTPFQRQVLEACRRIPPGEVVTYGQLAAQVGRPRAARAVGQAMAANPVPLVVPCHRVVAADGSLCGFSAAGGLEIKRRLLHHEGRFWNSNASRGRHRP